MLQNQWPREMESHIEGHVRATVTTWNMAHSELASLDSERYQDFCTNHASLMRKFTPVIEAVSFVISRLPD